MRRRAWAALSPAYRTRLERGGITRELYEQGWSLSAARGHAATPERPSRAQGQPARYRGYLVGKGQQTIRVLTTQGPIYVTGLSKRERSRVGRHATAVGVYLQTDDTSDLEAFEGLTVGAHELETRTHVLDDLALRGETRFESIYEGAPA